MKQDQFSLVSENFLGIPEDNHTINIELFRQNFTLSKFFAIKTFPTSNFLDDIHRTYSNFYKCRTSSTKPVCLKITVTSPGSEPTRRQFSIPILYHCTTLSFHTIRYFPLLTNKNGAMKSCIFETFRSKDMALLIFKDSYLQQKLIKFILKYYSGFSCQ